MGGCLDQPKAKRPSNMVPITMKNPESNKMAANRQSVQQQIHRAEQIKPKYKKMTINELLTTYKIDSTLDLSSKVEGSKYLSNLIDGSSKVLRIFNMSDIDEKRLQAFKKTIGFEIYENEQGSFMIIDEYCAGQDLYETTIRLKNNSSRSETGNQLLQFALKIFWIIQSFHKNKIWLGNLNLSSFRKISAFTDEVRLVDFNLNANVGELDKMGFAHRESFEADFQFMGYLIQFLLSNQPPIFVPHKMQYVQFQAISSSAVIQKLLKGNKCAATELTQIRPEQIIVNLRMVFGYKFRRDINKLLKMRKKRKAHNRRFYGEDMHDLITETKFQEEGVYRHETDRIFERINGYIEEVNSLQEEAFMNYSGHNQNLRRLKQVFLLTGAQKKMHELKECLSTIK